MGRGPARSESSPPSGHCKPPEWVPPVVLLGRKWALSSVLGTHTQDAQRPVLMSWLTAVLSNLNKHGQGRGLQSQGQYWRVKVGVPGV